MVKANDRQIAGDHYKCKAIQPWDYIAANGLGYFEGNIVKYLSRWRQKGGVDDLKKARHYLDKLIELGEISRGTVAATGDDLTKLAPMTTRELALIQDNARMREFIAEHIHPEGSGREVTQEVRELARDILRGSNGKTGNSGTEMA